MVFLPINEQTLFPQSILHRHWTGEIRSELSHYFLVLSSISMWNKCIQYHNLLPTEREATVTDNCYLASSTIEYNNVYFCKYLTHKSQIVWEDNGCMDHSLGPHTYINILLWEEVPINYRMQIKFVISKQTLIFFLFDVILTMNF